MVEELHMEQGRHDGLHRLAKRLAADVAAGGLSGFLISPVITFMDRAIVQQAATGHSLLYGFGSYGLQALKSPVSFLYSKPFRIIFTLYTTTYIVANGAESLCREFSTEAMTSTIVFASTLAFNVPLGVWKDVRFSQLFGSTDSVRRVEAAKILKGAPRATTAAFLARDAITIFGSFTLPGWVSEMIPSKLAPDPAARATLSQLTVPMLSQIAATPIHILGLDHYSRQDGARLTERVSRTQGYIPSTTAARCLRVIPAFGFGVLANRKLRESFQDFLGVY